MISLVRLARRGPESHAQQEAAGGDSGDQIRHQVDHQVLAPGIRHTDDLDAPPLLFQQCCEKAEPAARRAILVFDHHRGDGRVGEQREELGRPSLTPEPTSSTT